MTHEAGNATLQHLRACCQALDDKKALDLRVLRVEGLSSITDYMVVASGTSDPHLRALARAVDDSLREQGVRPYGRESSTDSGWVVVDCVDFMVHLFTPQIRDHYRLESLWRDADEVTPASLGVFERPPLAAAV